MPVIFNVYWIKLNILYSATLWILCNTICVHRPVFHDTLRIINPSIYRRNEMAYSASCGHTVCSSETFKVLHLNLAVPTFCSSWMLWNIDPGLVRKCIVQFSLFLQSKTAIKANLRNQLIMFMLNSKHSHRMTLKYTNVTKQSPNMKPLLSDLSNKMCVVKIQIILDL